jgi:hypothetical protein
MFFGRNPSDDSSDDYLKLLETAEMQISMSHLERAQPHHADPFLPKNLDLTIVHKVM